MIATARAGALFASLLLAGGALAATTSTVVDVPSGDHTQRFLYVRPDAPRAAIVMLPGGNGILNIQPDGSMSGITAACSPIGRNRQAFADRGYAVALVDAASNGSVWDFTDVREVVRWVQGRENIPVWVAGGSASTLPAAAAAINLPAESPIGVIFFSPQRLATGQGPLIRRPAFVIYNTLDTQQFGGSVYAALTSAPIRGQAALTGGSDGGCGYHLFNGLDGAFVDAIADFMDQAATFFTAAPSPNFQALWWGGSGESGWGVNITHQGDILFATWFTYDVDGSGMWLVVPSANRTGGNVFSGTMYRTTGPPFNAVPFDSSRIGLTQVGSATFSFTSADNGTFSYVVNGVSGSKAITRQVFSSPVPTCAANGSPGSTTYYQDLWWSAPAGSESGWGVNVTHQGDILFATWFTYGADGRGVWFVMPRGEKSGSSYTGDLFRTRGPPFNTAIWNPAAVVATPAGRATFTFADAMNGTFAYTAEGDSQSKPITRQVFSSPATVCR